MKKALRQTDFTSADEIRDAALHWFRTLPRDRFENELNLLYAYCKDVIRCDGDYITWK